MTLTRVKSEMHADRLKGSEKEMRKGGGEGGRVGAGGGGGGEWRWKWDSRHRALS